MTKTLKWLGGGIAAAMLLGLAGLFSGELAEAQDAPSGAPHRFEGTVTVDGEGVAAGTSVTAVVDGAECGSGAVSLTNASGSVYVLDVPASCAETGDTVSFKVGGYDAVETGIWNGTYSEVNLTAMSMMDDPDDPMEECPDEMAGDGMDDDGMDDGMGDGDAGPDEPDLGMGDDGMDDDGMDDDGMGDGMDDMDDCPEVDDGMGDGEDTGMDDGEDTGMDDGEDTGMDDGEDTGMGEDPDPGKTGTGIAATSTSTSLAAILGMMALAIALGGYTYARRRS